MDYSKYKFRAVVDWLSFEINTIKYTNFQSIKNIINVPFVEPLDKGDGNRASKFIFKFHDPQNWEEIKEILRTLEEKFPLAKAPTIHSIEVSIDAYSRTATKFEMIELTEYLFRNLSHPVRHNYRVSGTKPKDVRKSPGRKEIVDLLNEGRNICIGNIEHSNYCGAIVPADDEYMQIYYKTTDNNGKIQLPPSEHRARIEIRLSGNALPCVTVEGGESYKFELLAKYFNMRKVKQNLLNTAPISIQQAIERVTQLGSLNSKSERKNAVITNADKQLNDKFYNTLRDLSRRMVNTKKAGKTLV